MSNQSNLTHDNVTTLTANIVAAFVSNNTIEASEVPSFIKSVYSSMGAVEKVVPSVSVEDSIRDEHLVCLEDGREFKSLKRHLKSSFNLTPDEYRVKWGLPNDYPMVAPAYAKARSLLAKESGLGRKKKSSVN